MVSYLYFAGHSQHMSHYFKEGPNPKVATRNKWVQPQPVKFGHFRTLLNTPRDSKKCNDVPDYRFFGRSLYGDQDSPVHLSVKRSYTGVAHVRTTNMGACACVSSDAPKFMRGANYTLKRVMARHVNGHVICVATVTIEDLSTAVHLWDIV